MNRVLALAALCAIHPAFAMRLSLNELELIPIAMRNNRAAPDADDQRPEPSGFSLPLKLDQPITDELLEELNPAWIETKDLLHQNAKNQLLQDILNITNGPDNNNWLYRRKETIRAIYFGADPELRGQLGATSLLWATTYQDYHLAEYLLSKGANPNAKNSSETTPIQACKVVELAKLLIKHGAQIPRLILNQCCEVRYPSELMQLYLDLGIHKNPEASRYLLLRLLSHSRFSYKQHQKEKVLMLIKAGIDIMERGAYGVTALHDAALGDLNPNNNFCEILLSAKADVNAQDQAGQTALMHVCGSRSEPLCKLLIENGANVCTISNNGNTAIHIAAALKNEKLCELLLNHQMHINAQIKATLHCLWRLKKSSHTLYNETYRNFKAQLLPHFRPYVHLSKFLQKRNSLNKRPFDCLPIECLKPEKYKPVELK